MFTSTITNTTNAPDARAAILGSAEKCIQPNVRIGVFVTIGWSDRLTLLELTSDAAATPAEPSSLPGALRRSCFTILRSL